MSKKLKYISIILIVMGFIFATKRTLTKNDFEKANRNVDLVMSLEEAGVLSGRSGISLSETLKGLKNEANITSLAVSENVLIDMSQKGYLSYYFGADILRNSRMGNTTIFNDVIKSKNFDPGTLYIVFGSKNIRDHVIKYYSRELKKSQINLIKNNILEIKGDETEITNIGLGITDKEINLCRKHGFSLIPRIKDSDRFNEYALKAKMKGLKGSGIVKSIIFGGKTVAGFPKNIHLTAKIFKELNLNFGFVEFAEQEGDKNLYQILPKNSLRTHSITGEEMEKYTSQRILERLLRAVKERQVKLLVIHPVLTYDSSINLLDENIRNIKELTNNLSKLGYSYKSIDKINYNNVKPVSLIEMIIFTLSAVSAFILLMNLMGYNKPIYVWTSFVGGLILLFLFTFLKDYTVLRKLLSLGLSVIFPCLALIPFFTLSTKENKTIINSAMYVIKVFIITLTGAFLITGLLADEYFLSGSQRFSGVKVAFLLPLIITFAYYFIPNLKNKSYYIRIKKIIISPLLKGEVILGLFLTAFLGLYILRSGNYIVLPVSGIEEKFREFLDKLLFVRPRTKEIFIGYPVLLLTYYFYPTKIKKTSLWAFQCLGMIGLISLVNTFCHIHSPVYISLIRSINGLAVGMMIGFIYIRLVKLYFYLERIYNR